MMMLDVGWQCWMVDEDVGDQITMLDEYVGDRTRMSMIGRGCRRSGEDVGDPVRISEIG